MNVFSFLLLLLLLFFSSIVSDEFISLITCFIYSEAIAINLSHDKICHDFITKITKHDISSASVDISFFVLKKKENKKYF